MRVNQKIVSDTKNSSELLIIDICWDTMRLAVTELLLVSPKRPFTLSLDEVENDISQGIVLYKDNINVIHEEEFEESLRIARKNI